MNGELDHDRRGRTVRAAGTVVRSLATVAVMGWVYAVLPLGTRPDVVTVVQLALGLVILAGTAVWQIRAITRSPYPALRAVEAFAITVPLFVLLFSATYVLFDRALPGSFTQPLDRVGAFYFTVTVLATVGFGDIAPVTATARLVVTAQMVLDLGLVARAMIDAVRRVRSERDVPTDAP